MKAILAAELKENDVITLENNTTMIHVIKAVKYDTTVDQIIVLKESFYTNPFDVIKRPEVLYFAKKDLIYLIEDTFVLDFPRIGESLETIFIKQFSKGA